MTMADLKCDVCQRDGEQFKAVGVAATSIPYSCAYCVPCLRHHAEPELVFVTWIGGVASVEQAKTAFVPETYSLLTFKNGRYMTFSEWIDGYGPEALAIFAKMDEETPFGPEPTSDHNPEGF